MSCPTVAVIDYGAGNVRSVVAALTRLGASVAVTDAPRVVADVDLCVLPGVGSAASAMTTLRRTGVDQALRERVDGGGATLGICLGLQLALEGSDEDGGVETLGIVPGRAVRVEGDRVPRIGWSRVDPQGVSMYFAHSFTANTPSATAHSEGLVAEVSAGSFTGVQYHPEKSGAAGARFLQTCLSHV